MKTLVTGAAGFIGSHVAARLLAQGQEVFGLDNLNSYYDPRLKCARLARLRGPRFEFAQFDITARDSMRDLFASHEFSSVLHFAAQPGVRHSLDHPHDYAEANVCGFLNVLEGVRRSGVGHLIYASSSSVYGDAASVPFRVGDAADQPISLYAATKRAGELMAHAYSHLFGFASTGLRFFTVYGPWGRPDMAPMKFAQAIDEGTPIDVFGYGRVERDFTYIDDIVEGVVRLAAREAEGARIFNIGNSCPVRLMDFIGLIEQAFGKRARKRFLPLPLGDVLSTHADVEDLVRATGFRPATSIETGVARFTDWYREYSEGEHEYRSRGARGAALQAAS